MADYQLIVIGSGPGGYVAAIRAAELGLGKIGVIEKNEVGGTCLNRGCIPTKTFLHSANLYGELRHSEKLGITIEKAIVDMAKLYARKNEVVEQLQIGIKGLLKGKGITLINGAAKIIDAGKVAVNEEVLTTEKILIATGSSPMELPIEGADLPGVLTSDDVLGQEGQLYNKILILGGGVMGVEFASIYQGLGSEVVLIESAERLLPTQDKEISQNLQMLFKKRGIQVITGGKVQKMASRDKGLKVFYSVKEKEEFAEVDAVLITVGRSANTQGLFADEIAPALRNGKIPVDENYQTEIPGIYAIGDVVEGSLQLAHAASAQGINAVHAMMGKEMPMDTRVIPACMYTTPEIAVVGLTADEAKAKNIPVKTGKFLMSANGKNLIEQADRGFMKVVIREDTEEIIGAQLMCPRATELIANLAGAIANKQTLKELGRVVYPHPTFSESISEVLTAHRW
jgi:dihydrolipoamide dehydrogenase